MVGIGVDRPEQNAAMVEKLGLPFPLLSDPGGERAIRPNGVWHEGESYAKPATVVVAPDGSEAFRQVGDDFADRLIADDMVEALAPLELEPARQEPRAPHPPEPSDGAMPVEAMSAYFKGAKFAATAVGMRVPEAAEASSRLVRQLESHIEAVGALKR